MRSTSALGEDAMLLLPETAEELDALERSRLYLGTLACPLEHWEMLLLLQSGSWDPQRRNAPLPHDGHAPTPIQALSRLRQNEASFVRDVRFFLERMAVPLPLASAELVIGAIAASRSNRSTVLRWMSDPSKYQPEAEKRIRSLRSRVEALRDQLDRRRSAAWEASLRPAAPAACLKPVPQSPAAPAAVSPLPASMLADLRRAHRCSYLLQQHLYQRIVPWELLVMMSTEGEIVRSKLDALLICERTGDWPQIEEMVLGLVGRSVGIRCDWGTRVRELECYLQGVCERPPGTLSVGLEILLGAPAGRKRAARWIESPLECASEAAAYMSTVFAIADRYAASLDAEPVLYVTSKAA